MDFIMMCDEVAQLDFIADREEADHAIKAVLGIFASCLDEEDASRMTEALPEPLTLETLRGMQRRRLRIGFDEYLAEIATQFNLDDDQAYELVRTVFHTVKQDLATELVDELAEHLPEDWAEPILSA
jgi:uncharacterized protein (DUF2267 family)